MINGKIIGRMVIAYPVGMVIAYPVGPTGRAPGLRRFSAHNIAAPEITSPAEINSACVG